jgi:uncharacterized protein YidB (DUF937 family)
MGLLDGVLGSVLGSAMGQGQSQASQGGGMNAGLMAALLPIVLSMLRGQQGGGAGGGGGLGDVLGNVLGGAMGGAQAAPSAGMGGMGGLGELLNQFQRAGMADQAASWVSTGQNMPISADDIGRVFGNDTLARIAQQAGVSQGEASAGLAELLPRVVDGLTPEGSMPDAGQLNVGLDDLLRQLGRG